MPYTHSCTKRGLTQVFQHFTKKQPVCSNTFKKHCISCLVAVVTKSFFYRNFQPVQTRSRLNSIMSTEVCVGLCACWSSIYVLCPCAKTLCEPNNIPLLSASLTSQCSAPGQTCISPHSLLLSLFLFPTYFNPVPSLLAFQPPFVGGRRGIQNMKEQQNVNTK